MKWQLSPSRGGGTGLRISLPYVESVSCLQYSRYSTSSWQGLSQVCLSSLCAMPYHAMPCIANACIHIEGGGNPIRNAAAPGL